jgi:hypothetical protein
MKKENKFKEIPALYGQKCNCRPGQERDNCPACEGTGTRINFAALREKASPPVRYVAHNYYYQTETTSHADKLPAGTVSTESHWLGMNKSEPIIVMLDALLRYAKAYEVRFGGKLNSDSVLGDAWIAAACEVRRLLNGDGAAAWELDRSTDSKDNGACEAIFWDAMSAAGFTEQNMV